MRRQVCLRADAVSLITDVKNCETAFNDPFRLWPIGSYGYSDSLPKPRIPVRFGVGPCMGLRGGQCRLFKFEASDTIQMYFGLRITPDPCNPSRHIILS